MVLDHLHVHERGAGAVGQGHAVAGADEGVGAGLEDPAEPAGRDDDGLGADEVDVAGPHLHDDRAAALAVLDDEGEDKPLLVDPDVGPDDLLVEDVEEGLAGEVGHEEGACLALSAEGAGAEAALLVAAEDDAHVLHGDDLAARLAAHDLDGVLVAQVVAALHRVEGVVLPGVAALGEGRVYAALGRVGVAADGVDLRDDGHVRAPLLRGEGRPHACEPRAYDENVVVEHG